VAALRELRRGFHLLQPNPVPDDQLQRKTPQLFYNGSPGYRLNNQSHPNSPQYQRQRQRLADGVSSE